MATINAATNVSPANVEVQEVLRDQRNRNIAMMADRLRARRRERIRALADG